MKIKTECICPPIPTRNYDWACYDEDTYDMTGYDGETGRPFSSCRVGYGATEEQAIINYVRIILDDACVCIPDGPFDTDNCSIHRRVA